MRQLVKGREGGHASLAAFINNSCCTSFMQSIKCVVIGVSISLFLLLYSSAPPLLLRLSSFVYFINQNGGVGKTSMLISYTTNQFPSMFIVC